MIRLMERLGERMLATMVPSIRAEASSPCAGFPVGYCGYVCCNSTCTVLKACCLQEAGPCTCSACQHD